jgi:hypothetical protein
MTSLYVGYVGITRAGLKVTISRLSNDKYPFKDVESGNSYSAEGNYWVCGHPSSSFDIVGPWVEPVQPDSRWYPYTKHELSKQHAKTKILVKKLSTYGDMMTQSIFVGNAPEPFANMLAFKVVQKHVPKPKPREFWISKLTSKAYVENPNYPSYYTHVKEVI